MRAGKLRHIVDIEHDAGSDKSVGQRVTNWVTLDSDVPAEVVVASGNEGTRGEQTIATVTHIVKVRYRCGIGPQMRIRHEGNVFGIVRAVDVTGRRRELTIECKAVV